MTVALIAETGIRFMDVQILRDEIRVPMRQTVYASTRIRAEKIGHSYRRFVKMDDHTYVEKD